MARFDLEQFVPAERRPFTRYLSIVAADAEERARVLAVATFVANSIASSPNLHDLGVGPGDLVVLDLAEFGIDPKAWETMIAAGEPYYHVKTKVLDPHTGKVAEVFTDAGHVGIETAAAVRKMTGSAGAVVRADWFIHHATSRLYYLLSGTPDTLDGWYRWHGIDKKVVVALQTNRGANIFESGVTEKARRLSRFQGPAGAAWQTYDSFDDDDPLKDPFRVPGFGSEWDAGEFIAAKPNGLLAYALYNRKGVRQDSVPDRIAKDDKRLGGDGVLVPMQSCVRCHSDGGFRGFHNDMRALLEHEKIEFKSSEADRLRAFYGTDVLARDLARDQEDFSAAISKVTGGLYEADVFPKVFAGVVQAHAFEPVSPRRAALELGVSDLSRLESSKDVYVLALLAGRAIRRHAWEASFNEAAVLAAGER